MPDAAVFTKAVLASMKEDEENEHEESFIATTVEELASELSEV